MALIGTLPDTLPDRSIVIQLRRKLKSDMVKWFRLTDHPVMHVLCSQAARWSIDHGSTMKSADPIMPDRLNDRVEDAWRPLFAIADAAGDHWPDTARGLPFALTSNGEMTDEDANTGALILAHAREGFTEKQVAYMLPPRSCYHF